MRANVKAELLAPAGNREAFFGALNAGADAVYLAGTRFGARAYAENFTETELLECIRYGHLLGKKVYLAVNTLLKERELEELSEYIRPMYEEGVDAVIVQDFGVLHVLRERFPTLQLHASTQMSTCSRHGAELLKDMGVSRIVPARELSLQELREIRNSVDIELETFVHGAMCYCYSGQCLFSSILGGRSGNRGRCAQPCRLPYSVDARGTARGKGCASGGEGYYLSMKDLCSVEHLPALIASGIDSFKIEGRMKKPEYVAGVTATYRKYVDVCYELRERYGEEAAERYRVERSDLERLHGLYVRCNPQDGYFFRQNGREMITLTAPGYSAGDEATFDDVRDLYLKGKKRLPVDFKAVLRKGEPAALQLTHDDVSVTIYGQTVEEAKSQPVTEENVKRQLGRLGDCAFAVKSMELAVDEDVFYPLKQLNELRRQAVEALERQILGRSSGQENADFVAKTPLFLKENEKNAGNRSESAVAEEGIGSQGRIGTQGRTLAEGRIGTEERTGTKVRIGTEERTLAEGRIGTEERTGTKVRIGAEERTMVEGRLGAEQCGWAVSLSTPGQWKTLQEWCGRHPAAEPDVVYLPGDVVLNDPAAAAEACRPFRRCQFLLALPYVFRSRDAGYADGILSLTAEGNGTFSGVLVRSVDELGYFAKRSGTGLIHLDAGVYVWNSGAAKQLSPLADSLCIPYELRASEQGQLLQHGQGQVFEKIVYGRIPMMVTANCIRRTALGWCAAEGRDQGFHDGRGAKGRNPGHSGGCGTEGWELSLTDRYGKRFPVVTDCAHCTNVIYNSLPLSLYGEREKWMGKARLRLDFTIEGGGEMTSVLNAFLLGDDLRLPERTTGHEKRGVE